MKEHVNFYENLKEAQMRLLRTLVLYDGEPFYVLAITSHKPDGIFRVYLDPVGRTAAEQATHVYPGPISEFGPENPGLGPALDTWLDQNKSSKVLRKQMNSPLFNKFRPFPLGMCNVGSGVLYLERQPLRPKTEQGLTSGMVVATSVDCRSSGGKIPNPIDIYGPEMKACILGDHPPAETCVQNLLSGEFTNTAVAFHRDFAIVKGPIDMLFLAYKGDVIGVIPNNDFSEVRLGKGFQYCKEVVEKLGLFAAINC